MAVVKFPRPTKQAYNPNRPLYKNTLILDQVKHFFHVNERLPEELRVDAKLDDIKTEGEAAAYIARVTRAIHESGGRVVERVRRAT